MTLEKESIEDIFLMMSMKDEDLELANKAFNEFHRRYSTYLYAIVDKVCSSFISKYGSTLVNDVFSNTLIKVYYNADKLINIDKLKTELAKDKRMKNWLGKIASNEMYSLLRVSKKESEKMIVDGTIIEHSEIEEKEYEPNDNPISIERETLEKALKSLKERDREILLIHFLYEEKGKNMPSNVLDDLCVKYNTTKENIRQIKKRTLDKVKRHTLQLQK